MVIKWQDITNELSQIHPTVIDELHRRALKAEAALKEKEEENAILQQRLKQYDARWSLYELKMKSMEHTWHKQLTSLQVNLPQLYLSMYFHNVLSGSSTPQ